MKARVLPFTGLVVGLVWLSGGVRVIGDDCTYTDEDPSVDCNKAYQLESFGTDNCPTDPVYGKCKAKYHYVVFQNRFKCKSLDKIELNRYNCVADVISYGPPLIPRLKECADQYECKVDYMTKQCYKDSTATVIWKPVYTSEKCGPP